MPAVATGSAAASPSVMRMISLRVPPGSATDTRVLGAAVVGVALAVAGGSGKAARVVVSLPSPMRRLRVPRQQLYRPAHWHRRQRRWWSVSHGHLLSLAILEESVQFDSVDITARSPLAIDRNDCCFLLSSNRLEFLVDLCKRPFEIVIVLCCLQGIQDLVDLALLEVSEFLFLFRDAVSLVQLLDLLHDFFRRP